jgi:hypothetical protein
MTSEYRSHTLFGRWAVRDRSYHRARALQAVTASAVVRVDAPTLGNSGFAAGRAQQDDEVLPRQSMEWADCSLL